MLEHVAYVAIPVADSNGIPEASRLTDPVIVHQRVGIRLEPGHALLPDRHRLPAGPPGVGQLIREGMELAVIVPRDIFLHEALFC